MELETISKYFYNFSEIFSGRKRTDSSLSIFSPNREKLVLTFKGEMFYLNCQFSRYLVEPSLRRLKLSRREGRGGETCWGVFITFR